MIFWTYGHAVRCAALFALLVIPVLGSFAQQDSLAHYFDDGGISTGLLIKTDIISIIHGDAPLIAEWKLNKEITAELSVGVLMPYYVHDFLASAFTDNQGITNNRFGWSGGAQLKWYLHAPEETYWGMQYRRRSYAHIKVNEWYFTKGNQLILGKRMLLDVALGVGVRTQRALADDYMFDPDFNFMPILPLMVRFGYISSNQ